MLKRHLLIPVLLLGIFSSLRAQLDLSNQFSKGGWFHCQYLGAGNAPNTSKYVLTLYTYSDTNVNPGSYQLLELQVLNASTGKPAENLEYLKPGHSQFAKLYNNYTACKKNAATNNYRLVGWTAICELVNNKEGYISGMDSPLTPTIENVSVANTRFISVKTAIPGVINGVDYHANSTPYIDFTDTISLCYNEVFSHRIKAMDPDGDSLSYTFDDAPRSSFPLNSVTYNAPYSGQQPMGPGVTIDPETGLISGTAPAVSGDFLISVYVHEWRKGVLFNTSVYLFSFKVSSCQPPPPLRLDTAYSSCQQFDFSIRSRDSLMIQSYLWDFGVPGISADVSSSPRPTYTYPDTGTYALKMNVTRTTGCSDSAQSIVRVYPGFTPDVTLSGNCFRAPFVFTEQSTIKYGTKTGWRWDFGDPAADNDSSRLQMPSYTYKLPGNYDAFLEITSTKGCVYYDTIRVVADTLARLGLPFTDTLICSPDSLPLIASSGGTYAWSPAYNIIDETTSQPIVFPRKTTRYTVQVNENGCLNQGSINVRVVDSVSLKLPAQAGLCLLDTIILQPVSDALQYLWTETGPGNTLSNYSVKSPKAYPSKAQTTYQLTASIGSCQRQAVITVYTAAPPSVFAGADTTVCFNGNVSLNGISNAALITWQPSGTVVDANTLQTTARPAKTTAYLLRVQDTGYCRTILTDTLLVTVVPPFYIDAGPDLRAVARQPLLLKASGNTALLKYDWQPASYFNDPGQQNPTAAIGPDPGEIRFTVTATSNEGCIASDEVLVKIYKTGPDILVPTGFTPNGDGKNDLLRPLLVGVTSLDYFRVYNRYGQLVYASSSAEAGWDGKINGAEQTNDSFIYAVQGKDYTGKTITRKGTVVLIR